MGSELGIGLVTRNLTPKCKWDANAVLKRYEHDTNNSAKGSEYKTIGIKHTGGPQGGTMNLDALKGQIKQGGSVAHD